MAIFPSTASPKNQLPWEAICIFLVLALLAIIAGSLFVIARSFPPQPHAVVGTETEARAESSKKLGELLVKKGLTQDEARRIAEVASKSLINTIASDLNGDIARKFGDWIRAASPPYDPVALKEKEDAVFPYILDALNKSIGGFDKSDPSLVAKARSIFDALQTEDIAEIRKGFFGGLGVLPWDVLKSLIGGLFEKSPTINVSCSACDREDTTKPPVPCPAIVPGSRNCTVMEFEIRFEPDQFEVVTAAQIAEIEKAARHALAAKGATILLWAHTDTTASESHNLKLARERGEEVRKKLIRANIATDQVRIVPMGEYGSPVATNDNVPSPANRIVRIEVRSISGAVKAR